MPAEPHPKDPTIHLIFAAAGLVLGVLLMTLSAYTPVAGVGGLLFLAGIIWSITGLLRLRKARQWMSQRRSA